MGSKAIHHRCFQLQEESTISIIRVVIKIDELLEIWVKAMNKCIPSFLCYFLNVHEQKHKQEWRLVKKSESTRLERNR